MSGEGARPKAPASVTRGAGKAAWAGAPSSGPGAPQSWRPLRALPCANGGHTHLPRRILCVRDLGYVCSASGGHDPSTRHRGHRLDVMTGATHRQPRRTGAQDGREEGTGGPRLASWVLTVWPGQSKAAAAAEAVHSVPARPGQGACGRWCIRCGEGSGSGAPASKASRLPARPGTELRLSSSTCLCFVFFSIRLSGRFICYFPQRTRIFTDKFYTFFLLY